MSGDIKNILQRYGIQPSKTKGQNFLVDDNSLQKIVQAADLKKTDQVLEIGPGLGVLTEELIKRAKKVLAIELDMQSFFYLKQKFKGIKNLEIIQADILKIKNEDIVKKFQTSDYKLVANLPYNITKPVIRKFLEYDGQPSHLVVLVQKEVAEKIVKKDKKNSILSLTVGFFGQAKLIDYIPASSFYPQPKVESAILQITLFEDKISPEISQVIKNFADFNQKKFWQLVKIGYSSPRKQLHNNLAAGFVKNSDELKKLFEKFGWQPDIRPEKLSLADWARLYQEFIVSS